MPPRERCPISLRFAPLVLLFMPCCGFASDIVFSGSLERVGHESISVRLADRRVIDTRLPNESNLAAATIVAEYSFGDQVQITCKPIQPVWEEAASRYQSLELTKLRFVRRPSADELSNMLEFPPWLVGENLLSRPGGAGSVPKRGTKADGPDGAARRKLEHAREINLDSASSLPNFVADETAKRYTSNGKSPQWKYLDTIETEVTFKGNSAVREQIRKDGQPWRKPFQALPGFKWYGGFGTEIRPLFDPQCPTAIEYQGRGEVRGKQVLEYRFHSPADGCFHPFYFGYQQYNPARTGHVFIEDAGGNILQIDEEASGFPSEFEFAQRKEEVSWDYVKIGDTSHLLPVGANFVVFYSSGSRWRIEVDYKNHRHFEASTKVTFH